MCTTNLDEKPILGPSILLQTQELLGKQALMGPPCTVGISRAGSALAMCRAADKRPGALWETGRAYLPSRAAPPTSALLSSHCFPNPRQCGDAEWTSCSALCMSPEPGSRQEMKFSTRTNPWTCPSGGQGHATYRSIRAGTSEKG